MVRTLPPLKENQIQFQTLISCDSQLLVVSVPENLMNFFGFPGYLNSYANICQKRISKYKMNLKQINIKILIISDINAWFSISISLMIWE